MWKISTPYFSSKLGKMYSFDPLFFYPCSVSSRRAALTIPIRNLTEYTHRSTSIRYRFDVHTVWVNGLQCIMINVTCLWPIQVNPMNANPPHHNGVMWASWRLKSLATKLFVQKFKQADIKVYGKASYCSSPCEGNQWNRWIESLTKGQ